MSYPSNGVFNCQNNLRGCHARVEESGDTLCDDALVGSGEG